MNPLEVYIQFEKGLIRDDGHVAVKAMETFLRGFMSEFQGFVERVYTVLPRPA